MACPSVPGVPSPEARTSVTEGSRRALLTQDHDTMAGFCGESDGALSSPAGISVYAAFVAGSHVHWIGGNTTGVTEAGFVPGSHHSQGGGVGTGGRGLC